MDVKTKELITGDYRKFDFLEDIPEQFPAMVKKMMFVVSQKKNGLPKLAVDIFQIPDMPNVRPDTAAILTQLLANEMANMGTFRIFPRTDNIDAATIAYEQERSSTRNFVIDRTDFTVADFVLSCKISTLTTPPLPPFEMLGEIIDINSNRLLTGTHVSFDAIEDTPEGIVILAKTLSRLH
jgi:hypothetical protein